MGKMKKLLTILREDGPAYLLHKVKGKLKKHNTIAYSDAELEQQRNAEFPKGVKFSILVPLYNTPEKLLREMIDSVVAQTYTNWELCLADGGDDAHEYVGEICRDYARADARIRYEKLRENKGISGNTNACMAMATGDYIALFDHDDLLHPAALYEMMQVICKQGADFIYTDEDSFYETPADAYSPHYKPDFAPDTLRSYNYICHFTAFSRELMEKVGGERSVCDGAQDFDFFLRLTEQAKCIVHIPKILYYWRSHAASTASDVAAKPYVMAAGKRALADHLDRVGLQGEVEDSSILTTYRVKYDIPETPKVSIVLHGEGNEADCIAAIREKTTYTNYEIAATDAMTGEYVLLLHRSATVISPDWMQELLMHARRDGVGAVGAMLCRPDDTVAHAGEILGIHGTAGSAHARFPKGHNGYKMRMTIVQNYSAVSGCCMMVRRALWEQLGGLDSTYGPLADVDFCLRLRELGLYNVWTPYAELYLQAADNKPTKAEKQAFRTRWAKELAAGDPYYNPNLTLLCGDFSQR